MDLRDLWDTWTAMGEETAANSRAQRAERYNQPVPFPAQLAAGMVHPLTNFNAPGGDPIQQGIELGSFGISPFRGAIATARPAMTAAEQLWSKAQQGDIHATGQLTGDMWRRDLAEIPPMQPDPLFPDTQIRAPRAEPEVRARPGYIPPDDDYITMAPVPKGLFEPPPTKPRSPEVGEVNINDEVWNGEKWVPYVPPKPYPESPSLDPEAWRKFREGMDYLPPAGPEGYVGPPNMTYDDWQKMLSQMQARPLPPGINPFAGRD